MALFPTGVVQPMTSLLRVGGIGCGRSCQVQQSLGTVQKLSPWEQNMKHCHHGLHKVDIIHGIIV